MIGLVAIGAADFLLLKDTKKKNELKQSDLQKDFKAFRNSSALLFASDSVELN